MFIAPLSAVLLDEGRFLYNVMATSGVLCVNLAILVSMISENSNQNWYYLTVLRGNQPTLYLLFPLLSCEHCCSFRCSSAHFFRHHSCPAKTES